MSNEYSINKFNGIKPETAFLPVLQMLSDNFVIERTMEFTEHVASTDFFKLYSPELFTVPKGTKKPEKLIKKDAEYDIIFVNSKADTRVNIINKAFKYGNFKFLVITDTNNPVYQLDKLDDKPEDYVGLKYKGHFVPTTVFCNKKDADVIARFMLPDKV